MHPQDLRVEMEHTNSYLTFEDTEVHHDLSSLPFDSGPLISDARLHVEHSSMSARYRKSIGYSLGSVRFLLSKDALN